ncbi:MAG: hypothetical protein MJZ00_06635 [Paludibacteraceae bacterium]|nr:hypothetical protein [Paludibacteraceae bacterium]
MTDLYSRLNQKRLNKNAVDDIVSDIIANTVSISSLWDATNNDDRITAWHAAWVLEVLCKKNSKLLLPYQRKVVEKVLTTNHEKGELRLWLNISLMLLAETKDIDVDLLNFSLDNICNMRMAVAMRAVCIKIAHQICKREPELLRELQAVVSMLDLKEEQPAIKSVAKKVMK